MLIYIVDFLAKLWAFLTKFTNNGHLAIFYLRGGSSASTEPPGYGRHNGPVA